MIKTQKFQEISDLVNAILADDVDFDYKKMPYKQHMKGRLILLKLIK